MILKDISLSEDERQTTQIGELDRVLGGGIVPGSLVLVGGDPGYWQVYIVVAGVQKFIFTGGFLFCIFLVRSLLDRSSSGQIGLERLMIN